MPDKRSQRRISVLLNTQTIFHLERMAAATGHKNIGRVVDKLVREKMISLRTPTSDPSKSRTHHISSERKEGKHQGPKPKTRYRSNMGSVG